MKKNNIVLFFVFVLCFLFSFNVLANGSTAMLGVGGLELKKSQAISIEKEDLFISAELVKVDYIFKNTTNQDIETIVAFPLPALGKSNYTNANFDLDYSNLKKMMGFTVAVNGQKMSYQTEIKALVGNKDVTNILKKYHIPLSFYDASFKNKWRQLSGKAIIELIEQEIAVSQDGYMEPLWQIQVTYYWKQVFPAGKKIAVSHTYKPVVGTYIYDEEYLSYLKTLYCIDTPTQNRINKITKNRKDTPILGQEIGYILKTGKNWKGPIKDFRLVVDKGKATYIVSFCGKNINKISPTQYEVKHKNYVPKNNLRIFILGALY